MRRCSATFRFHAQSDMRIVVEPWANEYAASSGDVVEVVFSSDKDPMLEVELEKEKVTLFGWEGSTYAVTLNGNAVD